MRFDITLTVCIGAMSVATMWRAYALLRSVQQSLPHLLFDSLDERVQRKSKTHQKSANCEACFGERCMTLVRIAFNSATKSIRDLSSRLRPFPSLRKSNYLACDGAISPYSKGSSAIAIFSFPLLFTVLVFGPLWKLHAQSVPSFVPVPIAKKCGSSTIGANIADPAAMSLLRQVVSTMDPGQIYRVANKFNIAGNLVDETDNGRNLKTVGTFHSQEDHTVSAGDYLREAVTDQETTTVSRKAGVFSRESSSSSSKEDISKVAFTPKYYIFPLALLVDELNNPHTTARVISNAAVSFNPGLNHFLHIQTTDASDDKSRRFEVEDWYIDPSTHLPRYVGHQLPTLGSAMTCVEIFTEFSNYQNVSGAYIPTRIVTHHATKTLRATSITSLAY